METVNNIENQVVSNNEDQEIDFVGLVKRIWEKRRFIIIITVCFALLGIFKALITPKEYTSSCTLVPQTGGDKKSQMSSIASLAGINLNDMSSIGNIPPTLYPKILGNVNFQKELMNTPIKFDDWEQPVTLIDYYTNPDFHKFNLLSLIKKYTIGLPSTILKAVRKKPQPLSVDISPTSKLNSLNIDEQKCSEILSELVSLTVDEKKGFITLSARMGEPVASAQLAEATFILLQKYITQFKIEKAIDEQKYVKERFLDAKTHFEQKQIEYATFQDANRMLSTATANIENQRLLNEYDLAYALYSQLAKQLFQADLKVKEDTPILTAVEPIVIPYKRSKPQRAKLVVIWTFFGAILGMGAVFGFDWTNKTFNWAPKWWD